MRLVVFGAVLCILGLAPLVSGQARKPHVVLILADDYGHGNLGYNRRGQSNSIAERQGAAEVHTPTLDALADIGIKLNRHYAYKICSPSRSSLQTGRLAVHVNTENVGVTVQNPRDPVSGYQGIPRNMTGLASKMKQGGYRTHMVGKWDAGMATPEHTPLGRGFETWLGYYQHANDYWRKNTPFSATGEIDNCLNRLVDFSYLSSSFHGGVHNATSLSSNCSSNTESDPGCYEEHLFMERALEVIAKHDVAQVEQPLFLFYAFHLVHTPLEVPRSYLERIDKLVKEAGGQPIDSQNRRLLAAMVLYMDDVVDKMVKALKARNMWEDTLLIFIADNGGAVYEPGSGSNYPLKGGKYSDWEGGVRTNAFLSGGFIPAEKRGSAFSGVISIADWYSTLSEFAGVDPTDHSAIEANKLLVQQYLPLLHPIDSIAQWNFILNGSNARSGPLHLSENAVLRWPYKLVTGKQVYSTWQGAAYPNCTTVNQSNNNKGPTFADLKLFNEELQVAYLRRNQDRLTWTHDCKDGCLVNVESDPNEQTNLAHDSRYQTVLAGLKKTLETLNVGLFKPDRGKPQLSACTTGIKSGGYLGPFVDVDGWYNPVHLSPRKKIENAILEKVLEKVNQDNFEVAAVRAARLLLPPFLWYMEKHGHSALKDQCLANMSSEVVSDIII